MDGCAVPIGAERMVVAPSVPVTRWELWAYLFNAGPEEAPEKGDTVWSAAECVFK